MCPKKFTTVVQSIFEPVREMFGHRVKLVIIERPMSNAKTTNIDILEF